jgi:hypothetical protein
MATRMPTIRFTQNIQRHVRCPSRQVPGATLRQALEAYFEENQAARGYVLDDQGHLRRHMVIFVNGRHVLDRGGLSAAVDPDAVIDVMQALSGG